MLDERSGGRPFLAGTIGAAIGLFWSSVFVYALFAKNKFAELWGFLSYPIAYCIEGLWNYVVALGLFSQHNWIAFIVFLVAVSVLSGFVIGVVLSICVRRGLATFPRKGFSLSVVCFCLAICTLFVGTLLLMKKYACPGDPPSEIGRTEYAWGTAGILLGLLVIIIAAWCLRSAIRLSGTRKLCGSIVFLCVGFFSLFSSVLFLRPPCSIDKCKVVISNLGRILTTDLNYQNRGMPAEIPRNWSDFLDSVFSHPTESDARRWYSCPNVKAPTFTYAVNVNIIEMPLEQIPEDVVVLFESRSGENLVGQSELISFEGHNSKGCNVYFGNGEVRFVNRHEYESLRWK